MPAVSAPRKPSPILIAALVAGALVIGGGVFYLSRPAKTPEQQAQASAEAKAYVKYLVLSEVEMKASENLMQQQVVEVTGKVGNTGNRPLESVYVFCLFYGVNGQEIYRERVLMAGSKASPIKPNETRAFRLPFDSIPEGWNQALPKMVIARIVFAE